MMNGNGKKGNTLLYGPDNRPIDIPLTRGYKSKGSAYGGFGTYAYGGYLDGGPLDNLPRFTRRIVELMMSEPLLEFGMNMAKAPIANACQLINPQDDPNNPQMGYRGFRVICDDPNQKRHIEQTICKLWMSGSSQIMRSFEYGQCGVEVEYDLVDGFVEVSGVKSFDPSDVKPLSRDGVLVGCRVYSVPGGENGRADLVDGRGLWTIHDRRNGEFYGRSRYYRAYPPFWEKWSRRGAIDSRRLKMLNYAFSGRGIRYPMKTYGAEYGYTTDVHAGEIADQMLAFLSNGGAWKLPREFDEEGRDLWDITDPQTYGGAADILDYPKDLDTEQLRGIGLPDNLIQATLQPATGTMGGRAVTFEAFLIMAQVTWTEILSAIDQLIIQNWCRWNNYKAPFMIQPTELMPENPLQNPMEAGQPGMSGPPGMDAGGMPGGMPGMPQGPDMGMPQQMSMDGYIERAVGRGVLNASAVAEGQEAARAAIEQWETGETPYHRMDRNHVTEEDVSSAADETDTDPTDAQKESGNYKKGKIRIHGLEIAIENPKGAVRSGVSENGKEWQSTLGTHYGYIKRTTGADGDHVDVMIGDHPESEAVYVVDQIDQKGGFDEHKVMIGFRNEDEAKAGYLSNYEDGWKCGPITSMTIDQFKEWLDSDTTSAIQMSECVDRETTVAGEPSNIMEDIAVYTPNLIKIANDFIKHSVIEPEAVEDIVFTGSMAGYNYTPGSDIDVHVVVDPSKVDASRALMEDYFLAESGTWNSKHQILIDGHEVEVFIEPEDKPAVGPRYSLLDEEWLVEPGEVPEIDEECVALKARKLTKTIELALQDGDPQRLEQLVDRLRNFRRHGIAEGGEYSVENLAFKRLRTEGVISRLKAATINAYDKSMQMAKKKGENTGNEAGWRTVGGAPVYLDAEGNIEKGCPGLKGENVDDITDESDASRAERDERQEAADALGYDGEDLSAKQAKQLRKPVKSIKDRGYKEPDYGKRDETDEERVERYRQRDKYVEEMEEDRKKQLRGLSKVPDHSLDYELASLRAIERQRRKDLLESRKRGKERLEYLEDLVSRGQLGYTKQDIEEAKREIKKSEDYYKNSRYYSGLSWEDWSKKVEKAITGGKSHEVPEHIRNQFQYNEWFPKELKEQHLTNNARKEFKRAARDAATQRKVAQLARKVQKKRQVLDKIRDDVIKAHQDERVEEKEKAYWALNRKASDAAIAEGMAISPLRAQARNELQEAIESGNEISNFQEVIDDRTRELADRSPEVAQAKSNLETARRQRDLAKADWKDSQLRAVVKALRGHHDSPANITFNYDSSFKGGMRAHTQAFMEAISDKLFPEGRHTVDVSADSSTDRSYAMGTGINMTPGAGVATEIHEIGHTIEHANKDKIGEMSKLFLMGRARKRAPKHLGNGYKPYEVSSHGDYVHKYYPTKGSTEILSMGMQYLYEDAVGFAKRDPGHFRWTVGILTGELLDES